MQVICRQSHQRNAYRRGNENLKDHLVAGPETVVRAADDLEVIVGKANGAKRTRCQHGHPHVGVGKVGPQQCWNDSGSENQQTAHGGRPRLGAMRLRTLLADHLTNLEIAKLANHPGSEHETDEQR